MQAPPLVARLIHPLDDSGRGQNPDQTGNGKVGKLNGPMLLSHCHIADHHGNEAVDNNECDESDHSDKAAQAG